MYPLILQVQPKGLGRFEEEVRELEDTYEDCDKLISRLEELGYTCSYYLNAEPYDLRLNEEPTFDGQSEPYNANH